MLLFLFDFTLYDMNFSPAIRMRYGIERTTLVVL